MKNLIIFSSIKKSYTYTNTLVITKDYDSTKSVGKECIKEDKDSYNKIFISKKVLKKKSR